MQVEALRASLGATVEGLDLSQGIDPDSAAELRAALLEHQVLIFPGLGLDDERQLALAGVFGEPELHRLEDEDNRDFDSVEGHPEILVLDDPAKNPANFWHSDATFRQQPPLGALLSVRACPPRGGDTLWASTRNAHEELSEPVRRMISGLSAVHGHPPSTSSAVHPVVRRHPETGRPSVFVNRGWTTRIEGLSRHESQAILGMLFDHCERPEFSMRWSWSEGDAALWDNRCTLHYALRDYGSNYRRVHRIALAGDRPRQEN